jgi:hypothetical protein
VDAPAGTPWGWFHDRSEQQRNEDLRVLLSYVLVDPTQREQHRWIQGVKWNHNVVDDQGQPIGYSGAGEEADRLWQQIQGDL